MGVVIDTGVFVHWERRRRAIDQHLVKFDRPAFFSVVTASELLVGVHRADTPTRRRGRSQFVEAILIHLPIPQVSLTIARQHAELSAELSQSGTRIGYHDSWIAATALGFGYAVMTTNDREFSRVPGLEVLSIAAS